MTGNEIIKSLECCLQPSLEGCEKCPLKTQKDELFTCIYRKQKLTLDLINRQKAEIERLEDELQQSEQCADIIETMLEEKDKDISDLIFKERSNAILEFAEALKQEADSYVTVDEFVRVDEIDNLVKEMTEDDNG